VTRFFEDQKTARPKAVPVGEDRRRDEVEENSIYSPIDLGGGFREREKMSIKPEKRDTWKNEAKNQTAEPLRIYSPANLEEVVAIVKEAERLNMSVRAVGSGHSWSDVAVGGDFLVLPHKLDKPLPLEESLLQVQDKSMLFRFESGMRIRELNEQLDQRGLALPNMGGYDAQTYVGAMSTSTHGSGLQFGPLCDYVETIEIVADEGILYRIEPANGITDRTKYEEAFPPGANKRKLVQDDDWFNAVKVSMGCTGVIYSLILRAVAKFWLKEVRTLSTWKEVKIQLKQRDVLKDNDHYEVIINPYQVKGEHRCLVTTRNREKQPQAGLSPDKTQRNFLSEFLASLPFIRRVLKSVFDILPKATPDLINETMKGLVDDSYLNKSYKVFNIGTANKITAYSAEIGFPLENDKYLEAVDRFLEIAKQLREVGLFYLTSPVALRFVKATNAFLSPQYGRDTCMVEIIVVKGTQGAFEMYDHFENELLKHAGRPHWGQVNRLNGSHGLIKSMYPMYDKWISIYNKLNKQGTFDNPFSRRVGFREKNYIP
jgi:hypothetical protein